MARKPPPSAVLKTLPDDLQAEIYDALQTQTLEQGVAWLAEEKQIKTNKSSLGDWRGWYEMNLEIGSWNNDVQQVKAQLEAMGTDPDLVAKLGEARFLGLAAKKGDVEMYAKVSGIIQRHHELKASQQQHADKMGVKSKEIGQREKVIKQKDAQIDMQRRRIEALEAQAAAAKKAAENAKAALTSGGMDEATRQQLMEEMDRMILGSTAAKAKKEEAS